jgi:hypothetical protein
VLSQLISYAKLSPFFENVTHNVMTPWLWLVRFLLDKTYTDGDFVKGVF